MKPINNSITIFIILFLNNYIYSQVGIGTTSPKATLDIIASNQSTPISTDGILLPRVDAFPATNPGADQDAMLVYLTTTSGTDTPGFYYWSNASTKWLPILSNKAWELKGNAGTNSATDFIGTTDNQDISIRANNTEYFRFTTKGQLETFGRKDNILIGNNAGENINTNYADFGENNVFIGKEAGLSTAFETNAIGIGTNALKSLSDGGGSGEVIAIGSNALNAATSTQLSVAIGHESLNAATNAEFSVAIGSFALYNNTNSIQNVAIGHRALSYENSGIRNTAIGSDAGRTTGKNDNVSIGFSADEENNGERNVIIGSESGSSSATGTNDGRVLIGYQAWRDQTGNDLLVIENTNTTSPLVGGDFANDRFGINTDPRTLTHTFTVTGTAKITQVLNLQPSSVPATSAEGDVYYDSTLKKVRVYTGTSWENLN